MKFSCRKATLFHYFRERETRVESGRHVVVQPPARTRCPVSRPWKNTRAGPRDTHARPMSPNTCTHTLLERPRKNKCVTPASFAVRSGCETLFWPREGGGGGVLPRGNRRNPARSQALLVVVFHLQTWLGSSAELSKHSSRWAPPRRLKSCRKAEDPGTRRGLPEGRPPGALGVACLLARPALPTRPVRPTGPCTSSFK